MRRAKLGDVFAIQVSNGYRICQWAYHDHYIRVFSGTYQCIPGNVAQIVSGNHSFIIGFHISRAYRIGLAKFIENVPVPKGFPLPQYVLSVPYPNCIRVAPIEDPFAGEKFVGNSIFDLPEQYQSVTPIGGWVSPDWMLYLLDTSFNLTDLKGFWPGSTERLKPYADIVNKALSNAGKKPIK